MDAVLPLTARDAERFEILWASLDRFVTGLDTLWVLVPDHQRAHLAQTLPTHNARGARLRVESELDFLPTLRAFPKTGGWYRQMLLKLEAAQQVTSDFYLTLDADVLACRNVDLDVLCAGGTAPCHIDYQDLHPKWYRAAADILGASLPRTALSHQVTPALLHAPSVRSMLGALEARWDGGNYGAGLRGLKQRYGKLQTWLRNVANDNPPQLSGWCAYLCWSRPWAEYALYFSYLEQSGQFSKHFREETQGLYAVQGSVWNDAAFATWDPAPLFEGDGAPYFAVIQSNTFIPVSDVKARLRGHLY